MAKDFSDPRKLGFLRVIQVLCAFNVVITVALSAFLVKGNYELGFSDYLDYLNLLFNGVLFWLIWQRKAIARPFAIAYALFNIAAGSLYNVFTGEFSLPLQLAYSLLDIVLIAYFATSRRVRAQLVEPFSVEVKRRQQEADEQFFNLRSWPFWRNLIIYFCVFSVVGHWLEAGYCTFIRFGILPGTYDPTSQIWSDWLYPFCVYGVGAVACVLLFYPVKNLLMRAMKGTLAPLALSFVLNAAVCTLIELVMGLMLNQPLPDGSLPLWDYRNMFCNFMGQICLQNALAFGDIATLMTWVIYPGLETLLGRLSRDVMNVVFVVVVVGFCILFFFYCINVLIPGLGSVIASGDA